MDLPYLPWHQPATLAERPCMRDERVSLTYAEFATRVDAAAAQFATHGIGPGSVVAVMLPNRVELLISLVAAWRLGAAATPINPVFTATEADYQILDADAAVVIKATPSSPDAGRASIVVDDLWAVPPGDPLPAPHTAPDSLALLIYTSGSTGKPKGVMLNHANIAAMGTTMVTALRLTPDEHCLLVLPLFHSNAINVSYLATMIAGGQLSILSRFHPVEFVEAVERLRPTYFSGVPTIYSHLVSLPAEIQPDTSSVRLAICGAAPASKELLAATAQRFGFPLLEGYGLTEGTCASTANPLDGPHKPGTVGVALPGQTVAIMGPDGTLLGPGERGEVVIQGPTVMQGYLNRPEATADTLGDGWLHTGDVGILDEDGYLSIVDRIKDMIIRGGENIYPKEIESVLARHTAVLEATVVGAPDPVYGEVPAAFVTLYPDHAGPDNTGPDNVGTTEQIVAELRALCAEHLTRIKLPDRIEVVAEIAKNPVGKPDKPAIRAQLAAASQGA